MTDSTRGPVRARVLFGTCLLLIGIIAVFLLASHSVSAGGAKTIQGYVYDENGQKFGVSKVAHVTVIVKTPGGIVRQTLEDDTDANGLYRVSLSVFNWDTGDTLEVFATYNSVQSPTNTTTCSDPDDFPIQNVDVHFPTAIPQFGSIIGSVLASVFVGSVAVVALGYRRH